MYYDAGRVPSTAAWGPLCLRFPRPKWSILRPTRRYPMTSVGRGSFLVSASLALALAGSPGAAALGSGDSSCRDFIAKKVLALTAVVTKQQISREQKRALGTIASTVDCSDPD